MKKMNTSPLSGMMELLPPVQATFNEIKSKIAETYHLHGFLSIETPTIDRNEILFAKAGGDTEKQIYRVIKTEESADDSDQSLRFDHTVPLARYIVEHESDLAFPFRVTQIGKNFRGERAQKGRYREFYQCDVDVIGRNSLPIYYDAEVITACVDALKTFVKPEMVVRVSNRKISLGLVKMLGLENVAQDVFGIIDHAEKVPLEKTAANLSEVIKDGEKEKIINEFIFINGSFAESFDKLAGVREQAEAFQPSDEAKAIFSEGCLELEEVSKSLEKHKVNFIVDMMIIRGLDYYTGTVFETFLPEYKQIGSICSGGRYENLASNYTDQSFPGVGGSIGLSRLFYVLSENGLIEDAKKVSVDFALVPISENEYEFSFDLAEKLRKNSKTVDIILTDKKLGDRITHASKVAKKGIVIGENEVQSGNLLVKDFETGNQEPLNLS